MLPIITKGELTFRSGRTLPARAQSSGSETLLRTQSLAGCTIGMLESSIRKRQLALYEQPAGFLFPGRGSGPKAESLLSGQIKRSIESHLGLPFHTHMFRALAGYLHLKESPNGFEAVRALLGNRDDRVIRSNYALLAERLMRSNIPPNVARFSTTCRPDSIYDRDKRELKNRPVGHVRLGPQSSAVRFDDRMADR